MMPAHLGDMRVNFGAFRGKRGGGEARGAAAALAKARKARGEGHVRRAGEASAKRGRLEAKARGRGAR